MKKEQIVKLISKYNEGTLDDAQRRQLDIWYLKYAAESTDQLPEDRLNALQQRLRAELPVKYKKTMYTLWSRMAIAASILMIAGAGIIYWNAERRYDLDRADASLLIPGKQSATLTLGNGKKIRLSEALNGELAKEAGIRITKATDGQLVYELLDQSVTSGGNQMNTLTTSNGETYKLILPDGSSVWLNAASSLKYATGLKAEGIRKVELLGEAYFEVFKDDKHPFIVQTNRQRVEVLGTHFNINSYAGNITRTTLLEGMVKINSSSGQQALLKPNQQAEYNGAEMKVKDVVASDAVAWKNGYFMFNNENLETVMEQIARWYNVQVTFEDEEAKGGKYFGTISRNERITNILKMLAETDLVQFKIEGKAIKVRKK